MPVISLKIGIHFTCDNCGTNIKSTKDQYEINKSIDYSGVIRDLGFLSSYKTKMVFCSYDCKRETEKKEETKQKEAQKEAEVKECKWVLENPID